jgi:3-deoxy-D-manno-octulosonic-acid transferase
VLAAAPLIARIRRACPPARLVLTCQTEAGCAAGRGTAADDTRFFPVDTRATVDRVINLLDPRVFVFVETELWPSLLLHLAERDVPAVMVNASVSQRSYSRYRRVRSLMSAALGTVAAVCARDQVSRERLVSLGADAARARVTGDLKMDALSADAVGATPDLLAEVDAPVLVAASTHEGEEEAVLDAFTSVRARHAGVRLVLAPRHVDRAPVAIRLARDRSLAVAVRSAPPLRSAWDVLVIDTTGELRGFMKKAYAVFVGGSFDTVGGHNLLEPAAFGAPVATGPGLDGVREQADLLASADALAIVGDAEALAERWSAWLDDPQAARGYGLRALGVVRAHAGALERTWAALGPLLVSAGVCADRGEANAVAR